MVALWEKWECEGNNFDHIWEFLFCLCLNCTCSIDLNNSSFEFSFISLTDRFIIITGHVFYCDYKFKQESEGEREKKGNLWRISKRVSCLKRFLFTRSLVVANHFRTTAYFWRHDGETRWERKTPNTLLMRAQIISITEKSKITSITLMRCLRKKKRPDCDHFCRRLDLFFQMPDCITIISGVVHSSGA